MVKKLFKHEFIAMAKFLLPVYIVLPCIALLGRIIQFFENDSVIYNIVYGSSSLFFGIGLFATIFLTGIFSIVRFYKNLFSSEGYLSFTLPVTPAQHLTVKALTSVCFMFFSVLTILISVGFLTAGEVFAEIIKAASYLVVKGTEYLGVHLWLYLLEFILLLAFASLTGLLIIYACISIGQTFKKNRIIAAVGVYFAYYFLTQIIGTVIIILFAAFGKYIPFEQLGNWIALHPYASVHIFFGVFLVLLMIGSAIFFTISRFIITRKLNIE